jgi:hypothetical protein
MKKTPTTKEMALLNLGTHPLEPGQPRAIDSLSADPAYSSIAYKVHQRRGHQTMLYHTVAWPVSHWWNIQDWMNNTQLDLEQLFGPSVRLVSSEIIEHDGKPMLLAFYQIGPIFPTPSTPRIAAAWRKFITAIRED